MFSSFECADGVGDRETLQQHADENGFTRFERFQLWLQSFARHGQRDWSGHAHGFGYVDICINCAPKGYGVGTDVTQQSPPA